MVKTRGAKKKSVKRTVRAGTGNGTGNGDEYLVLRKSDVPKPLAGAKQLKVVATLTGMPDAGEVIHYSDIDETYPTQGKVLRNVGDVGLHDDVEQADIDGVIVRASVGSSS